MTTPVTRPRLVIAAWLAVIGLLVFAGADVEEHLHRATLDIPGSDSARATDLAREHFGEHHDLVVMLEGPPRELDRQGRRLAAELERREGLTVLDPWSLSASATLRPAPGKALLMVRSHGSFEDASRRVAPAVRSDVERLTGRPLEAHVSGYADIAEGLHRSQVDAIRRAELVAAPLLIVILLFVFRGPLAAALPLFIGSATIAAGRGVLEAVNDITPLDPSALNLASMMGLALGVDYALLLVSRFRGELAAGADPTTAGLVSVATAGRTIVFAGVALASAMTTALIVAPGSLLSSASAGLLVAVALSVLAALTALPAMLVLLGHRVNVGSPARQGDGAGVAGLALRALRRPALAAGLVLAVLATLAVPAFGLQTGPPDPRVLPEDSRERTDYEAIRRALGGGWGAPYEITVVSDRGPITARARLAAIARWQRQIAGDSDVLAVLGPAAIEQRAGLSPTAPARMRRAEGALGTGSQSIDALHHGLGRAEAGVLALEDGLARAAAAGERLAIGSGGAAQGASRVRAGAGAVHDGASGMVAGLSAAHGGADGLAAGLASARSGARALKLALARAQAGVRAGAPQTRTLADGLERGAADLRRLRRPAGDAVTQLDDALGGLRRMLPTSQQDPEYRRVLTAVATAYGAVSGTDPESGAPVAPGYAGLDRGIEDAAAAADRAARGANAIRTRLDRLDAALRALVSGASRLDDALARLQAAAADLRSGIARLTDGERRLAAATLSLAGGSGGLEAAIAGVGGGARELHAGLADASVQARPLAPGVRRMLLGLADVRATSGQLRRALDDGRRLTALQSGYATLAAIDSSPSARRAAGFTVNVDRGGTAAQIVVIQRGDARRRGNPLRGRLERQADEFARATDSTVGVGGPAALLQDFDAATNSRGLLLVLALMGVTYVVLVPLVRSLLLPLLAVLLTLLTVRAAFGVVAILFQSDGPLGGPGFVDAIMASGIFTLAFALSIDYVVFVLARMREGYRLTGTNDEAIAYAVRHTARVITGAALIMTSVFVAFALADVASMRQLGIGLSVAVLLDATLVRLVLLPAAVRLAGPHAWRLPAWLDRRLPRLDPSI